MVITTDISGKRRDLNRAFKNTKILHKQKKNNTKILI